MIGESAIIEMIQTLGDIIKDKIQRMAFMMLRVICQNIFGKILVDIQIREWIILKKLSIIMLI